MRLQLQTRKGAPTWVWWVRLDRRNGYLAWGPVGQPFNRRSAKHWLVAVYVLWRDGRKS